MRSSHQLLRGSSSYVFFGALTPRSALFSMSRMKTIFFSVLLLLDRTAEKKIGVSSLRMFSSRTVSSSQQQNAIDGGGDHSISIGSVMESINNHKNVGVLWIDAHPDINTIESSKTKNFHGMPLSFITGLEKSWDWINPMKKLSFDNLHYWGIRDIDEFENNIIERSNIINHLEAAKNMISNYDYIHLSLDIDGIDPKYTPSTGTPVSKGLELYDVNSIIEYLVNSNKDYTIDIVEYNPEIGSNYDKLKTNQNVNSIIGSLTMI